ncbi:hypothetical protein G7051_17890 [Dysgonomonas sp. HDW5B]|uniref:hypothetical protein n=1 Tax=Dysgonomonas sp. HDW5B TaxID=2714927 RepID=UPI00140E35E0|nr:hypothetical protein [Dysgonomonas sp. HDW5B]QIK56130.1 hypothetical protein G7051_17890 [Dysgonomonas sp. HDW5B]
MKRLLILLLLPLLIIACSKDDETEQLNNMSPAEKDKFLIGQWVTIFENNPTPRGLLYLFKSDNTFEFFEIVDVDGKKIRKTKNLYKSGTYNNLNYGIEMDGEFTLLFIHSKTMIGFPSESSYTRDNSIYTLVE